MILVLINLQLPILYLSHTGVPQSMSEISATLAFSLEALPWLSMFSLTSGSVFEQRKLKRQSLNGTLKPSELSNETAFTR